MEWDRRVTGGMTRRAIRSAGSSDDEIVLLGSQIIESNVSNVSNESNESIESDESNESEDNVAERIQTLLIRNRKHSRLLFGCFIICVMQSVLQIVYMSTDNWDSNDREVLLIIACLWLLALIFFGVCSYSKKLQRLHLCNMTEDFDDDSEKLTEVADSHLTYRFILPIVILLSAVVGGAFAGLRFDDKHKAWTIASIVGLILTIISIPITVYLAIIYWNQLQKIFKDMGLERNLYETYQSWKERMKVQKIEGTTATGEFEGTTVTDSIGETIL
ncbi:MAG: hypothetical protein MHMPM18_002357 [Marteilia pararefringens]